MHVWQLSGSGANEATALGRNESERVENFSNGPSRAKQFKRGLAKESVMLTVFIAVDGRAGADTASVADEIARILRRRRSVSIVHLEDLYPGEDGLAEGIKRCATYVLGPLLTGQDAAWRAWNWETGQEDEERLTLPTDVVILQGTGSGSAELRRHCHAVVWVEVPQEHDYRHTAKPTEDAHDVHCRRWTAQEDAWLAVDNVALAADITITSSRDSMNSEELAALSVSALAELPILRKALASERDEKSSGSVLYRKLSARPDPEGLFAGVFGGSSYAAWLDASDAGSPGAGPRSRYSIMADDGGGRGRRMSHFNGKNEVVFGPGTATPVTVRFNLEFFTWLSEEWGQPRNGIPTWTEKPESFLCDFELGWVGYLGYGLQRECGYKPVTTEPDGDSISDVQMVFAARAVVLDHEAGCVWLLALDSPDALTWLDDAESSVMAGRYLSPVAPSAAPSPVFRARDSAVAYRAKVQAAKNEITEGNTYEVCLTTTLEATVADASGSPAFDPWTIYRRLRGRSPASFAAFARFGPLAIASSSPERFLQITEEGSLRAEPIKGTRRRSPEAHPDEDARIRAELAANPKDRAENLMIVDLMRNDLSHFAIPGSVSVSRLFAVESYSTVHQLVSTIEAKLRPGASRAHVVAAAFPPGSMTGAPKISTMGILERLEAGPRGVYSGALGYFSRSGAADLSVVIRTLVMNQLDGGTQLTLGVGGAIVADSTPEEEHDEIRTKAFAVLSTLGTEFPE